LSVAMMLRNSFGMSKEAAIVEETVRSILKDGFRTRDIHKEGTILVNTSEMGDEVVNKIRMIMTRL
jgi:3-isopropylmalate dehydrogenase